MPYSFFLKKPQVFANSELEIVAEKCPNKEPAIGENKRQEISTIFEKIQSILAKNSRNYAEMG